ncbi:MAG: hypothetical protein WBX27_10280 [Specibacter sp.]
MSRPPKNPTDSPAPEPGDAASHSAAQPSTSRPPGVYVIAAVVALESLGMAGAGVWFTIGLFTQAPLSMASAIFLIVLVFALSAGLAAVAVNAFKGYRWTRSAAFVWQLLMVAISVPELLGGDTLIGLLLLLPPLAAMYYLFTPRVVTFSQRTGGDQPVL